MIPIRLELKNFMSYGEDIPALDFSGMHTLCLSGENGHGKSALLDAITWALWGESRAGKNKHDELVRIGADEMSVHFTFEMDGQKYRAVRKYSKKATGRIWELQSETEDQGLGTGWRSLTGNSAGETEKAIQKLLRMSYDTFLNSAYLRQGQADQFVRQTPAKRKEILADILDLSRYDQLEAKAREQMKAAQAEATDLERDVSLIEAELKAEPELREQIKDLLSRQDILQARQAELRAEWDTYTERKNQVKGQKQLVDTLTAQISTLDSEIGGLSEELAGHQTEADRSRALLARRDEISRSYDALLAARVRLTKLDADLETFRRGQQMLAAADKEWAAAENKMKLQVQQAVADHTQALAVVKDYAVLTEQRAEVAPRVNEADREEAGIPDAEDAVTALRELFATLREENSALDFQVGDWNRKLTALGNQQGICDVCAAPLPPTKVAAVQTDYLRERDDVTARQKEVKSEAARVKQELNCAEALLKDLRTNQRAARADREKLAQLVQSLFVMEERRKTLPNLQAVREDAERALAAGEFAPEARAKIEKYETALQKYSTIETDHAEVKAEAALLEPFERQQIALEHAQAALTTAEAGLGRTQASLKQRRASRDTAQAQLAGLPDVGPELIRLEAQGQAIRGSEKQRAADEQAVHQEIGRREQTLTRLEEQKAVREEKSKRLSDAKYTAEVHGQLTQAFGKKGVQALIIENAIPELMEETNRLLDRLTDGGLSLYFETIRESKSKSAGPIETLDIKVSDNLGTRPLEMYSGGEGFRAAFALRIALSKLLSRRAGAKLQTLIIDEGFGSQDAKGREKLVECLNAIKEDFERIIVITHIDELKDAFATRVEVIKTPTGSQITVMEGSAG